MPFHTAKNILLWFLKPFYARKKRYWRIVFLCFVAASTFWLLNALNKSYTTRIAYPVRFVYDEQRIIPVEPLPTQVQINVTGKGWKLLPSTLMLDTRPAEIFIRNLPSATFIPGPALRPAIASSLDGLQLNFIITDTLFFRFDYFRQRVVPLALDTTQADLIAPGYAIDGPVVFTPQKITFEGPASLVDSLPSPYRVRLPVTGLTRSFNDEVPLQFEPELVSTELKEVNVKVNVVPLLTEEVSVVPQLINYTGRDSLVLQPAAVKVRYRVPKGKEQQLDQSLFRVVLDYARRSADDSAVTPELVQKPRGVRQVTLAPAKVKIFRPE